MYTIEHAKISDVPTLLELASTFWQESETYSQRPMDIETVKTHLQYLICYPSQGCVLVCKDESGTILGGFVGGITKEWFSSTSLMAFDYCLFVSSNNRGGKSAYLLVKAFIEWAKEAGATVIQCGTATKIDTDKTINFYKKMGFEHTGSFLEMKL
ncbi:GNAT family N-acetyltransferase [Acinetobacter sp. 1207_04]|uniref:N-acetyltransferase family protein n=1 Tax=Acinetobacter sp. 1207_04 TaxID=2604449 RepID=UPI0040583588